MGRVMIARKNKMEIYPGYIREERGTNEPETKADMLLWGCFEPEEVVRGLLSQEL